MSPRQPNYPINAIYQHWEEERGGLACSNIDVNQSSLRNNHPKNEIPSPLPHCVGPGEVTTMMETQRTSFQPRYPASPRKSTQAPPRSSENPSGSIRRDDPRSTASYLSRNPPTKAGNEQRDREPQLGRGHALPIRRGEPPSSIKSHPPEFGGGNKVVIIHPLFKQSFNMTVLLTCFHSF